MRYLLPTLALLLAVLMVAGPVPAQMSNQPSVKLDRTITVTATVVGIDRADRELTLQGPQGNMVTVDVEPSVKNFDQIQLGDKVDVDYYQAVTLSLGPKGQKPAESMASVMGRGPAGTKPEGYNLETVDVIAVIKSINRQNRMVTLQGPQGNMFSVQVPKDVKAFDQMKVGDSVQVRYTEATAVAVRKR